VAFNYDGGAPVVLFSGGGFLKQVEVIGEVRRSEEQQENSRGWRSLGKWSWQRHLSSISTASLRFRWPAWTRGQGDGVAHRTSSLREEKWSREKGEDGSALWHLNDTAEEGMERGVRFEVPRGGKRRGPRLDRWAAVAGSDWLPVGAGRWRPSA
jgi:hypothetical protein